MLFIRAAWFCAMTACWRAASVFAAEASAKPGTRSAIAPCKQSKDCMLQLSVRYRDLGRTSRRDQGAHSTHQFRRAFHVVQHPLLAEPVRLGGKLRGEVVTGTQSVNQIRKVL